MTPLNLPVRASVTFALKIISAGVLPSSSRGWTDLVKVAEVHQTVEALIDFALIKDIARLNRQLTEDYFRLCFL